MTMPVSMQDNVPELQDFAPFEKMRGEYDSTGIYTSGHLMEFIRPSLPRDILTCAEIQRAPDGKRIQASGWPIARQHPQRARRRRIHHTRG